MTIKQRILSYKYELFLVGQLSILFGTLLVPSGNYGKWISLLLFCLNVGSGSLILFAETNRGLFKALVTSILITTIFILTSFYPSQSPIQYLKFITMFAFYIIVTWVLIRQVWRSEQVTTKTILGLIAGFINLGLVGFFIFLSIELVNADSFSGMGSLTDYERTERVMYFSFITLLTIGYGEIVPETDMAQKATIFVGLIGQLYLAVLTAIIIGKYLTHQER
ncbi:potassium channel family protein [Algivirga pacifica]|uniref:Potassium channel domain-containing protein n=1 Tax=Algivirga pacifica TaxID=1162670 RepID=A0ABP9DJX9_9BACT